MGDARSCGPLCQHPACWISGRMEMIEAFKRLAVVDERQDQRSDICMHGASDKNDLEGEESLPTLKIVNLFGNEEDLPNQESHGDSTFYVPTYLTSKEKSMQMSSAATRSSRHPKAPCVTPSPSYASQYFLKQKKASQNIKSHHMHHETKEDDYKKLHTAYISIQELDENEGKSQESRVPYLIWIPAKKSKKKKRKRNSAENASRVMNIPRLHTKNITGNNSDFGFLATPFNKEGSVKCYSRATHTVVSSPTKLHPRRLPPISRETADKSRCSKDVQLAGDGLFTSTRITPGIGTPQNTRASIYTRCNQADWDPEFSEKQDEIVEHKSEEGLCVLDKETLIIERNVDAKRLDDADKNTMESLPKENENVQKEVRDTKETKEVREELMLARVTVPKAKLKKLPIENHCRNSIPSHHLSDIQMQPIDGVETTISSRASENMDEMIEDVEGLDEQNNITECLSEDVQVSDDIHAVNDMHLYEDADGHGIAAREELTSHWEVEQLQAPAPTPSTPMKRTDAAIVYGDMEVIEIIRKEQERRGNQDSCSECSQSVDRASSSALRSYKAASLGGSPAPSKSSSSDFASDKDMMRQTYEQYRSFTPFKTPGVSLMDTRLTSIKEASREHTFLTGREKSLMPAATQHGSEVTRLLPDYFEIEPELFKNSRNKRKKNVNQIPFPLRSILVQRRSRVENISEINVSTMKPLQRKIRSRFAELAQGPPKEPFTITKFPLRDPATKTNRDYVSSYELYEALVDSQSTRTDKKDSVPVVIPAPIVDISEKHDLIDNSKDISKPSDSSIEQIETDPIVENATDVDNPALKGDNGNEITVTEHDNKDIATEENNDICASALQPAETANVNELEAQDVATNSHNEDCISVVNTTEYFVPESKDSLVDADSAAQQEVRNSQDKVISVECDSTDHTEEYDIAGHIISNSNASISISDLSRKPGIASKAEKNDESDDSDQELTINAELGLNFMSFTSELDLSLNIEDLKKEFEEP